MHAERRALKPTVTWRLHGGYTAVTRRLHGGYMRNPQPHEVDGPTHFMSIEPGLHVPSGPTRFKHRQLAALGWDVTSVNYVIYQQLDSAERQLQYLASLVGQRFQLRISAAPRHLFQQLPPPPPPPPTRDPLPPYSQLYVEGALSVVSAHHVTASRIAPIAPPAPSTVALPSSAVTATLDETATRLVKPPAAPCGTAPSSSSSSSSSSQMGQLSSSQMAPLSAAAAVGPKPPKLQSPMGWEARVRGGAATGSTAAASTAAASAANGCAASVFLARQPGEGVSAWQARRVTVT